MIVPLKDQQINHHFGIGPYVYFMNDPLENGNTCFLDRVKEVDLKYHTTQCCQIMKDFYKAENHFSISIKSLEACVVEDRAKILSFIDPTESQIKELYIYVKTKTEEKLTAERINSLLNIIKTENLNEYQIFLIKSDIDKLRSKKHNLSQVLLKTRIFDEDETEMENESNIINLKDKTSNSLEINPKGHFKNNTTQLFNNYKKIFHPSKLKTYSRKNLKRSEWQIDTTQRIRNTLLEDVKPSESKSIFRKTFESSIKIPKIFSTVEKNIHKSNVTKSANKYADKSMVPKIKYVSRIEVMNQSKSSLSKEHKTSRCLQIHETLTPLTYECNFDLTGSKRKFSDEFEEISNHKESLGSTVKMSKLNNSESATLEYKSFPNNKNSKSAEKRRIIKQSMQNLRKEVIHAPKIYVRNTSSKIQKTLIENKGTNSRNLTSQPPNIIQRKVVKPTEKILNHTSCDQKTSSSPEISLTQNFENKCDISDFLSEIDKFNISMKVKSTICDDENKLDRTVYRKIISKKTKSHMSVFDLIDKSCNMLQKSNTVIKSKSEIKFNKFPLRVSQNIKRRYFYGSTNKINKLKLDLKKFEQPGYKKALKTSKNIDCKTSITRLNCIISNTTPRSSNQLIITNNEFNVSNTSTVMGGNAYNKEQRKTYSRQI